ncbi:MAG: DNA replication complex GINS family protein [Candidatus Bathyarchaeota archaeon]|nr:DNA replication complex GINS family protein [Candidatus Bathyarchaeota archaeon]
MIERYLGFRQRLEAILENSLHQEVRLITLADFQGIDIEGFVIPGFKKDSEVKLPLWVAIELVKAGIVEFKEDERVDMKTLSKLHWIEVIQPSRVLSPLPENFYLKLKFYLDELKAKALREVDKIEEYRKALMMAGDIASSRLRKVMELTLAKQTIQTISNLSIEERILYEGLRGIVEEWRNLYWVGS